MTKISPKIVFFGTENYSLITLEALVEEGFNVVCVITKPDTKRGRGHKLTEPPAEHRSFPDLIVRQLEALTRYKYVAVSKFFIKMRIRSFVAMGFRDNDISIVNCHSATRKPEVCADVRFSLGSGHTLRIEP
jgi:methionyl-tRNA formyltransferase